MKEEMNLGFDVLIGGVVHYCFLHLHQTAPAKENCAREVLKYGAHWCAVRVHYSLADGCFPTPEALPDAGV